MKVTEAISNLKKILEQYGDCEIVALGGSGIYMHSILEFEFIGGNRLLIKTNTPREKLTREIYRHHEQMRNKQRKKAWYKDCD